jgi:hypothetical protein
MSIEIMCGQCKEYVFLERDEDLNSDRMDGWSVNENGERFCPSCQPKNGVV